MRAATIRDGEVLVDYHPDPEPGSGEILVRVRAAGLNGADMLQRRGRYPAPPGSPPDIPGLELAGEVIARGPGAERFAEGDRAMAVVGGGGQAELCVVHERGAMPVPEALDWSRAGGTPEVFATADDALFSQAGLEPGERLLVHGAAGGVGAFAVQIARARGAQVIGTASSAKHDFLRDLGASEQIDYTEVDFVEAVRESHPDGIHVVFDLFGGDTLRRSVDALADGGRIVSLAEPPVDDHFRQREIKPAYVFVRPSGSQLAELSRLIDGGEIRVELEASYPLAEAAQALERLETGRVQGKLALELE